MTAHNLTSDLTADEIEALPDPEIAITYRPDRVTLHSGDDVILTSADGAIFLGRVADAEPDRGDALIDLT